MTRLVLIALLAGCSGGGGGGHVDAAPDLGYLLCPRPDGLPFDTSGTWNSPASATAAATQTRIKHQPADLVGSPEAGFSYTDQPGDTPLATGNEVLRGIMARIEPDRGYFGDPIAEETVSFWHRDSDAWRELGTTTTADFTNPDTAGSYLFDLGAPPTASAGFTTRYAVLDGDGTCGAHYAFDMPAGRAVVVADIDGTLTLSDDELIMQVSDGAYDPVEMGSAHQLMQAWADKGYAIIYLTARPHVFRSETRAWLDAHQFPTGLVVTAPELVTGDAARSYKALWLQRMLGDLGWAITAAYGNAQSDIDAYADAGISTAITFIVGDLAGTGGTTPIDNLDYADHITGYVDQQPDA